MSTTGPLDDLAITVAVNPAASRRCGARMAALLAAPDLAERPMTIAYTAEMARPLRAVLFHHPRLRTITVGKDEPEMLPEAVIRDLPYQSGGYCAVLALPELARIPGLLDGLAGGLTRARTSGLRVYGPVLVRHELTPRPILSRYLSEMGPRVATDDSSAADYLGSLNPAA